MHMIHLAESQLESGNTNFDSYCLFLSQKITQSGVSHVILTLSLVSESLTPSDLSFLSSSPVLSSSPNRDLLSFPFHLVQVVRVQDYFPLSQMALNKKTSTPDYSSDITQSQTCLMSAAVLHLTATRTSCVTRVYMHLESFLHSSTRIQGSVIQVRSESKPLLHHLPSDIGQDNGFWTLTEISLFTVETKSAYKHTISFDLIY